MEDPYSILNIAKDATKEEIQESYKALLKKYDISSIEDEETQDIYLQKLSEINLAYTTLIKSLIFKEVRELISMSVWNWCFVAVQLEFFLNLENISENF